LTLVDSNILLDLVTRDERWAAWSLEALGAAAARGPVVMNEIVYAEISVRYARSEEVDAFIEGVGLTMEAVPRPALFHAAKVFERYRKLGGTRTGVLPDFFIGAHAATADLPLLTRDPQRYRSYFPAVRLLMPG
jgi:predicted nucleic acid-binding protein